MILILVVALRFNRGSMDGTAAHTAATQTLMEACTTAVFTPECSDSIHVIYRLRASHVTVFHPRVCVISRLRMSQNIIANYAPILRILTMFASHRHRISDVEIATIIRSKGEKHALGRVDHVRKMPMKFRHISGCRSHYFTTGSV